MAPITQGTAGRVEAQAVRQQCAAIESAVPLFRTRGSWPPHPYIRARPERRTRSRSTGSNLGFDIRGLFEGVRHGYRDYL